MSFALALVACTGCRRDFYAKQLIVQDTGYGKLVARLTGTAEQLLRQKCIDMHQRIAMPDGMEIDVWVIRAHPTLTYVGAVEPHGTVLLIHGLCDSKASYLPLGERLSKMGYDVVLPDLRAHGCSGGRYVTYGALERHDVKAVMDELIRQGAVHVKVYAFGVSLGGAVAIQYAAIEPRCRGVMAMAPYKNARSISRRMLALIGPTMSNGELDRVLGRAGQIAGFNPAEASALNAAEKLNCPILLVHGLLDIIVPIEHSQAIYEAAGEPKQLVVIPWVGHATLLLGREAWIAEQIDLIARTALKKKATTPEPQAGPVEEQGKIH